MSVTRETISSMSIADIQNELEANGLSIIGNKKELVQRLFSFRRSKQAPALATSFSMASRITSSPVDLREQYRDLMERVEEREKKIDDKIEQHFEKLNKQLMLFVGATVQNNEVMQNLDENDCFKTPEKQEENHSSQIIKLNRKLKMIETNIELVFEEIERLEKLPSAMVEMQDSLRRLNTLENDYSINVQEIVNLMSNEDIVDQEIKRWSDIQREILNVSRKANSYIDSIRKGESELNVKPHDVGTPKDFSGVNHLRLPKFTLPEFSGEILEWVPWWDQFKTCIHENNSLGDRERFNYLLMYLKGAAKRSIEYIEVTSENYKRAIEMLKGRYGRTRIVVEYLLDSVLKIEKRDKVNAQSLRYLYDTMVNRYHTLESYEPNLKYCHRIMVPILQSKLPQEVRKKWEFELSKLENEEDDKKVTVEYFFRFLRSHVMSEEASEVCYSSSSQRSNEERKYSTMRLGRSVTPKETMTSGMSLASNLKHEVQQSSSSKECAFCGKSHESSNCFKMIKLSVDERLQLVKEKKLCFNCLCPTGPNHISSTCKKPGCLIEGCNKKHHVCLHRSSVKLEAKTNTANTDHKERLLPTASAKIKANGKEIIVHILVDSGSDHSYIRREVAEALNLTRNGAMRTMTIFMLGGQKKTMKVENVSFQVSPVDGDKRRIDMSAWAVDAVCAPLEPLQLDTTKYKHLKGLKLADRFPRQATLIDVLVGADQLSQVLLNGIRKGPSLSPCAINSIFGWLLTGCVEEISIKKPQDYKPLSNHAVVKIEEDENQDTIFSLKAFWELESIGIMDHNQTTREETQEEKEALQMFKSTVKFDGRQYEVTLPWKSNCSDLKSNYQQALRRMLSVEKVMHKDERKKKMYKEAMQQYFKDGHARELTEDDERREPVFYLPHHPVIREDKTTTKCRVVFDASARNQQGISLNDCLLPGPALQPNLIAILLRFRMHRVAIMADIRKMFLQIKLAQKDQNCHRFLWRENLEEDPKVFCMTRVTFGVICSPFQAIATVHHHATLNENKFPIAAKEVKQNMYVDDLLTGENDVEKAYMLHKDLCTLMKDGGFDLVKWYTNSTGLLEKIEPELRGPSMEVKVNNKQEAHKALGISWNTNEDTFMFSLGETLLQLRDEGTKRSLISIASKVFDPLGLISPYTVRVKIMFQDVWTKGLHWDDALDEETSKEWQKWKDELRALGELAIPRCLHANLSTIIETEIHGFCDASTKAYGATVYMRCKDTDNNTTTQLVIAKSKVAPTKRLTLPRLELLAAFILSRLIKFVIDSLITAKITDITCWSDSQVALAWICQPSKKWKVFVANRVQEIQEHVPPEHWRYCPGKDNPADLLTRGESLPDLIHSQLWWKGPQWLAEDYSNWPQIQTTTAGSEDLEAQQRNLLLSEAKSSSTSMTSTVSFQLQDRYETWQRLVRITAWILKWSRQHPKLGYLSSEEIKVAEETLIRKTQQEVFPEEIKSLRTNHHVTRKSSIIKLDPQLDQDKDLLVVGGRLQFAQIHEDAKHQIIIPRKTTLSEKLILHEHTKASHAGPETTLALLRQRYWPTQGRREVKRVLRKCLICKHWKTKPIEQKMAPLPKERVQIAPAFTNIGIDFTGPLYLKQKGQTQKIKAYVCIFVCEDTRAVHLELTNDMTTEEFLQAFRRMANRRGMPQMIRSDNQSTFHKSAKVFKTSQQRLKLSKIDAQKVKEKLANEKITWKFITERASHRGGHWERVCRQLKEPLRKVLGKAFLSYSEMYTVLTDIEAIINSRPLTYISDDIEAGRIITPALLAIYRDLQKVPDTVPVSAEISLKDRYRYLTRIKNHFWDRWQREYLPRLTSRQRWTQEQLPLKANDVVLISDDNIPRGQWKLGKVEETYKGADGLVRTARVKTTSGSVLCRPVQRLHLLEEGMIQHLPRKTQIPLTPTTSKEHTSKLQDECEEEASRTKKKNGSLPLRGEDVQTRTRIIKKPKRFGFS